MHSASQFRNNIQEFNVLQCYHGLGAGLERACKDISQLAVQVCRMPVALISLVEKKRKWFEARFGLGTAETLNDVSFFCAHAILSPRDVFIVEDARNDQRFASHPLVTKDPNICFYAGVPLLMPDGGVIGTLSVMDHIPRVLGNLERQTLLVLANQVVDQLEYRRTLVEFDEHRQSRIYFDISKTKLFSMMGPLRSSFVRAVECTERLKTSSDERMTEDFVRIYKAVYRLSREALSVLDQVVDCVQAENAVLAPKQVCMSVDESVQRVVDMMRPFARTKHIYLQHLVGEPRRVYLNVDVLELVVQQVLSNAIKFTPGYGSIDIKTQLENDRLTIHVQDTGVGISEDMQEQLFKIESCQSTLGTAGEEGSGLGLLICYQALARYQGMLKVASILEQGTLVTIQLPAYLTEH